MAEGERYAETALLVAVMSEDWDKAEALVRDMLPGERRVLQSHLIDVAVVLQRGYVPDVMRANSREGT